MPPKRARKEPIQHRPKKAFIEPNSKKLFEEFLLKKDTQGVKAVLKGGSINVNGRLRGDHYLIFALREKQVEVATALIEAGCKLNFLTQDPLSVALEINEPGIAKRILEDKTYKLDTSSSGSSYYSAPIVYAAEHGHVDIVKILLDMGCDINAKTYHNKSPLGAAISKRNAEMTSFLLEAGAVPGQCRDALSATLEADDDQMATLLIEAGSSCDILPDQAICAIRKEKTNIVQKMLDRGLAKTHFLNEVEVKPSLMLEAVKTNNEKLVKILAEAKVTMGATGDQKSPLEYAIIERKKKLVKLLLDCGCPLDYKDNENDYIPMITACELGDLDLVKDLVTRGASVHTETRFPRKDCDCNFPLGAAAKHGFLDIVKYLVSCGADVNQIPTNNKTAFYCACLGGQYPIMKHFVSDGAQVNPVGKGKSLVSSLLAATESGKIDCVRYLIDMGYYSLKEKPKFAYLGYKWRSPLHLAAELGHADILKLLIDSGCEVNAMLECKDKSCPPAVWLAAYRGSPECVTILCENGADINVRDDELGLTAIMVALAGHYMPGSASGRPGITEDHYIKTISTLLKHGCNVNMKCKKNQETTLFHAIMSLPEGSPILREIVALTDDIQSIVFCPTVLFRTREQYWGKDDRMTPAQFAASQDKQAVVEMLIDSGVDLENESWWVHQRFGGCISLIVNNKKMYKCLKAYNTKVHHKKKKKT